MPPQPLWQKGVFVGPQVEDVIARTLAKDPSQRFASVQQFAQALQSSSNAQPGMPLPAPSSNNPILPAPFHRTPGFSYPSAPPAQPHLTPRITPIIQSPTSGLPPSPPTVYPGYVPTQPAPQYVPPRKTGFPCLATALISVVAIFVIVIGSMFAIPLVSQLLSPGATATATQIPISSSAATAPLTLAPTPSPEATATPTPTQTPTPSPTATIPTPNPTPTPIIPANITVSPQTLKATNGSSNSDCDYWGPVYGTDSGWVCKTVLTNNNQNMINWSATVPPDSQVDFRSGSTGILEGKGGTWPLIIHIPLKDCRPGGVVITITPEGGTPQKVIWTCS